MHTVTKNLNSHVAEILQLRKQTDRFRVRRQINSAQGAEIQYGDRKLLNFCSNDYLGLANHSRIIAAFKQGADRYGVGSGASHMICGHNEAHAQLEERLADFVGRQRVLLFSTGYMANLAIVTTLLGRGDDVFQDRLNHASMIDAASMSRAKLKRYPHADENILAERLKQSSAPRQLVLTDSVFSMDGDLAPLPELVTVCKQAGAWFGMDDAHGFGVLGDKGAGAAEHYGLSGEDVPIQMVTLGKALGCFGAFVAGDEAMIEAMVQTARSYIYTTAPPPALAVAAMQALNVLQEETWRKDHLHALIDRFRTGAENLNLPVSHSITPIQPLMVGSDQKAVALSQVLEEKGIMVTAIRPPTVPEGTARLRITLSAAHTEEQVDRLLETLGLVMR